ncbi:MAG: SRPBCC family protein [Thermoplasmatota archaeon]
MGSFTQTHTTPASPDAVWAVIDDFGGIANVSRGVAHAELLNDVVGVGQERFCAFDAKGKQWARERITERGDDHIVISIYETNAPMKHLEGTIRVTPAGSGSQISMTMDMKVKGGPLGDLMEVALVRPNFKKAIKALLDDIGTAAQKVVVA